MKMNKTFRALIVDESDVTTVISVINSESSRCLEITTNNCGWVDEPKKWFVMFYMRDRRFENVLKSLSKIGDLNMKFRSGGQKDLYFERA